MIPKVFELSLASKASRVTGIGPLKCTRIFSASHSVSVLMWLALRLMLLFHIGAVLVFFFGLLKHLRRA